MEEEEEGRSDAPKESHIPTPPPPYTPKQQHTPHAPMPPSPPHHIHIHPSSTHKRTPNDPPTHHIHNHPPTRPSQTHTHTYIHTLTALGSVSSAIRSASLTAVNRFMRLSGPANWEEEVVVVVVD
jgi:hypothetical protein